MKTSQQTSDVLQAIFEVKKELGSVSKSGYNPHFKSKYADLNTHIEEVEPLLTKHGCMLLQPVNSDNTVETRIIHVSTGQWISSELLLVNSKNTMQDLGSAITYARRYTLGALLSMMAEDDDGEKSMVRTTKPSQTAVVTNTPPKPVLTATEISQQILNPINSSAFSKKGKTPVAITAPTGSFE